MSRVELVSADSNSPIYSISGADQTTLRPAVVDLSAHLGKDIFVRLVDDEAGAPTATYIKENPWAHINFDHFRFHESKPFFVNEITPADITTLPPVDPVRHAGLSPKAAAPAMSVPKGFSVTLAATEPQVVRPIAFAYDDFGAGQARLLELADVPPDVIKFDMSLVQGIAEASDQRCRTVRSLVKIVRSLGVTPLAEGVETPEDATACREIGFELTQGYWFGRPAPATNWLLEP